MPELNNVQAIREYFALNGGREVTLQELKALTAEDRAELGELARIELARM